MSSRCHIREPHGIIDPRWWTRLRLFFASKHGPMTTRALIDKGMWIEINIQDATSITRAQIKGVNMSFSFGFSGDDIEEDVDHVSQTAPSTVGTATNAPPPIPARTHDLDEVVGKEYTNTYLETGI